MGESTSATRETKPADKSAVTMGRCSVNIVTASLVVFASVLGEPAVAFSSLSGMRTQPSMHLGHHSRCARAAHVVASLRDPVEGGADGSMEKILGNVGLGKFGKGIDWFFDTSTISGAKAWQHQEMPGEADSRRFRKGDELEEMLQDQISSRTLERDEIQAMLARGDDAMFSSGEVEYSLEDGDLSSALTARLQGLALQANGMDAQMTGAELAFLCYKKYGLYHDMALKCDMLQLVSDKKLVSVNIYYAYYGQLNPRFPYSEAEYLAKCDLIATAINQWGQGPYVREFFAEPPRAYRGLPSRPRWDTAVSIRLYKSPTWTGANVEEWFLT